MDLFGETGFRTGIAIGLLAAVVIVAVGWVRRRTGRTVDLPIGCALAAAALWAVASQRSVPLAVVVCVVGIAAAHALGHVRRLNGWIPSTLAVPFAWALAVHGGVIDLQWFRLLVAMAVVVTAPLLAAFDGTDDDKLTPAFFALTTVGIAFAVPDTEEAAAVLGVVLPLALLGWPLGRCGLGRAGAAAAVSVAVWVAAVDARGRPPALIGAVACFALPGAIAVVRAVVPEGRIARARHSVDAAALIAAHAVLVAIASRVAGTSSSVARAAVTASFVGVVALAIAVVFVAVRRRDEPRARTGPSTLRRSRSRGRTRSESPPRPAGSRRP